MAARKKLIKVEDNPSLARDTVSNAIINTDETAYAFMVNSRRRRLAEAERMNSLESDVSSLKETCDDIQSKLDLILQSLNK